MTNSIRVATPFAFTRSILEFFKMSVFDNDHFSGLSKLRPQLECVAVRHLYLSHVE